ncbi:MAG TPA: DinB family protein [Gemmatimonadales bacterium]|nr:DinB family protein [Gemmatimonadales bacterium]
MATPLELYDLIVPAWQTNARVTADLVRALPVPIYRAPIPGFPRRTVRAMAVHLHNSRCRWLRTLGQPLGIRVPRLVDADREGKPALVRALHDSARGMTELLARACQRDGRLPATSTYVWRNLALDVGHILTYFVGHEAHHRGQLILVARQLGHPIPKGPRDRLWWWKPAQGRARGRPAR